MENVMNEKESELLMSSLEKLPLFTRTILYLASGASAIKDPFLMNQFAETGRFFPRYHSDAEKSKLLQTADSIC